jgi:hypothetical protein
MNGAQIVSLTRDERMRNQCPGHLPKIWGRVAFAGGLISTAGAAHDLQGPQESALSTTVTGLQTVAGGAGIAKGLIEDIPVAGQVFAGISVGFDILGTAVEVYNCHP